jgi:UDPglucose--hexose-1-phosphate uridylyltransferase
LRHWKNTSSWSYGLVFKNIGEQAGATLEHLHSQLVVLPLVPSEVLAELAGSSDYFHQHGACVYCQMIQHEITANQRLVLMTNAFAAYCPFASRFAFETWIVPRHHASHFDTLRAEELRDLASILHCVLGRLESLPQHPAYNLVLHTAPFDTLDLPFYHWHMEIIPRLSRPAGFEWGSGSAINDVDPQDAASQLRGREGFHYSSWKTMSIK